jgi:radical SAM protein with 4Fe4S-binding SPASM domain
MIESADTIGTLQTFKTVADNPLTRNILKALSKHCRRDEGNRLEVALELYVGIRENACFSCKFSKRILSPILGAASKAFGLTETQLKEKFRNPYWRRGLLSVIKGIAWFGVKHPYVPGAPFQVVWNITRACNLRCVHCYENAGLRGQDELTTQEVLRGIDILADAGVLILAFSGGEPTIRPDILQLIKRSSDRGMYPAMATNAIVFASRRKVKEFKEAGLQFVQISLDGLNPETHDKFRGVPGAFKKTVQGIKNCVAEGLFVEIATTATRFNYKEIPAMIEFAEKLGVNWFMLYNFVPTGRGVDIIESDLTPDEREDILKVCWNKMKTSGIEVLSTAPQFARIAQEIEAQSVQIGEAGVITGGLCSEANATIVPTHFYNPELPGQLKRLADFIGGCGAGRFYMSLEPNGDMFPCVFFPHEEAVKVGNLFKDNFEDIWRNSRLLWQIRDKDRLAENCGRCNFRYTCGGCRARAYNYFKDILAPDPGCVLNKEFWERIQTKLKKRRFSKETKSGDILLQTV